MEHYNHQIHKVRTKMLKYVRKITVHSETQIEQWVIEVSGICKTHKEEHIRIIALLLNARNSENIAPKNIIVIKKLLMRTLSIRAILIAYGTPSVGGDVIPALMPDASLTAIVIYVSPEALKMQPRFCICAL